MTEVKQIKKVEKWEARDGSFHDTLEAAQRHQLVSELKQALQACQSRPEDQAQHILCHFDIVRKGDHGETINPRTGFRSPPPTTEWRRAPNTVCTTCYFVTGGVLGCLLTLAIQWLR